MQALVPALALQQVHPVILSECARARACISAGVCALTRARDKKSSFPCCGVFILPSVRCEPARPACTTHPRVHAIKILGVGSEWVRSCVYKQGSAVCVCVYPSLARARAHTLSPSSSFPHPSPLPLSLSLYLSVSIVCL